MKSIIDYIESNYNKKDIAHIYSIILRANTELTKQNNNNNISFELKQTDNFIIKYDKCFKLIFDNKTFTANDLNDLIDYIYNYYEKEYPINYDYRLIDPIYFSLFFYDLLDKIIMVKEDMINIKNIRLLRYKSEPVTIEKSERYKALVDRNYKMFSPFKSNSIFETPEERLNNILKSIKDKGYGYDNQVAIFYNDEPYIRDGQHRVSAVKYLNGDIDIKIIRFYLKGDYFYE
ncbi:MAG: hypothetical protein IJ574_00150 [Bacilli bacterium]|nr:hypothetical protein [Bacilli bacterium]